MFVVVLVYFTYLKFLVFDYLKFPVFDYKSPETCLHFVIIQSFANSLPYSLLLLEPLQ